MENLNLSREYYEKLFESYPDVVDFETVQVMLGGVSHTFVRRILQKGILKNFMLDQKAYMIPKEYLIDYVTSPAYQEYKYKLKAQI